MHPAPHSGIRGPATAAIRSRTPAADPNTSPERAPAATAAATASGSAASGTANSARSTASGSAPSAGWQRAPPIDACRGLTR
jgi:hypothetical protein